MRLAVPDLISPSYFPAIAAIELGIAREEGLDLELELNFPVTRAADELRAGDLDLLVGAAHVALAGADAPPVQLLAAVSQRTYWFLVVRPDLVTPGMHARELRNRGSAPLRAPTSR
jgi:ABC-type nitrate/sulfonate/bicarbonate transport system substrate-binding protein